ncbi:MAG: hypothetical protein ABJA67_13790, partial [Chthonomonadales bacterium]
HDDLIVPWDVEEIDGGCKVYMRVHYKILAPDGKLSPSAFVNHPKDGPDAGMSTNWGKHSTASQCQNEARQEPFKYAVAELNVEEIRKLPQQTVIHSPLPLNRAHTDVGGDKSEKVRVQYYCIAKVAVALSAEGWVLKKAHEESKL